MKTAKIGFVFSSIYFIIHQSPSITLCDDILISFAALLPCCLVALLPCCLVALLVRARAALDRVLIPTPTPLFFEAVRIR